MSNLLSTDLRCNFCDVLNYAKFWIYVSVPISISAIIISIYLHTGIISLKLLRLCNTCLKFFRATADRAHIGSHY